VYFSAPFGNLVSAQGANLTDPWAGAGGNPMVRLAALRGLVCMTQHPFFPNGTYVNSNMKDSTGLHEPVEFEHSRQIGRTGC